MHDMKSKWLIVSALALSLVVSGAVAQDWQTTGADAWIEGWLGLEIIENNGGFAASGLIDFISEGPGGSHTHETVSTQSGVRATQSMVVSLADYGGDHTWMPITIDTTDGDNMNTSWGLDPGADNTEWHGIIIAASPIRANQELFQDFQWMVDELHGTGDAMVPGDLTLAILNGYRLGCRI